VKLTLSCGDFAGTLFAIGSYLYQPHLAHSIPAALAIIDNDLQLARASDLVVLLGEGWRQ
jgi:hypothetical protein